MGTVVTGRGDGPDPEPLVAALRSAGLDVGRAGGDDSDGARHVRRPGAPRRAAPRAPGRRARAERRRRRGRSPAGRPCAAVRRRPAARAVPRPASADDHRGPRPAPAAVPHVAGRAEPCAATATARSSPRRPIHEAVATEHGLARTGGSSRSTSSPATRSRPPSCVELVRAAGVPPRSTTTSSATAMAAAGVDPAGFDSDPSIPLDPDADALEGFRLVLAHLDRSIEANRAGHDRRRRPGVPARVPRRRPAQPLGAPARPSRCCPPTCWRGPETASASSAQSTGPPRDLDVYVLEWDDYVDRPGRRDRGRAASRCATSSRPTGPPPTTSSPRPCGRERRPALLRALVGLARRRRHDPATGGPHADQPIARGRPPTHREGPGPADRARPGDHAGDAGRGRPRAAQGRQEAALPPRVLRRPAPDERSARRSSSGSRRCRTTSARTRTPRCTSPSCARPSPSCRRRRPPETFVAIGQLIEQLEQSRQARPRRVRRAVRRLRQPRPPAGRCARVLDGAGG